MITLEQNDILRDLHVHSKRGTCEHLEKQSKTGKAQSSLSICSGTVKLGMIVF